MAEPLRASFVGYTYDDAEQNTCPPETEKRSEPFRF